MKYTRDYEELGKDVKSEIVCMSAYQVFDDTLKFDEIDPIVCAKLYKTQVIKKFYFNTNCYVLEDVEFLTKLMSSCTFACNSYIGYYYRITSNSLIQQGLNIKKLIGSIASQNSCIEALKNTTMRERSYQFKYNSLFNWLIRTAGYDNWKNYYKIIRKEVRSDFVQIIKNNQLGVKNKIVLIICAINLNMTQKICSKK